MAVRCRLPPRTTAAHSDRAFTEPRPSQSESKPAKPEANPGTSGSGGVAPAKSEGTVEEEDAAASALGCGDIGSLCLPTILRRVAAGMRKLDRLVEDGGGNCGTGM